MENLDIISFKRQETSIQQENKDIHDNSRPKTYIYLAHYVQRKDEQEIVHIVTHICCTPRNEKLRTFLPTYKK